MANKAVTEFCSHRSAGCPAEKLTLDAKLTHQQACAYALYTCPYSLHGHGCTFFGSPPDLHLHLLRSHADRSVRCTPQSSFTITKDVRFVHFVDDRYESKGGELFVLDVKKMEIYSFLEDQDPRFPYSLGTKTATRWFVFQPKMVSCRCANDAVWNTPVSETDRSADALFLDHLFRDEKRMTLQLIPLLLTS